jgi:hypothetical protein
MKNNKGFSAVSFILIILMLIIIGIIGFYWYRSYKDEQSVNQDTTIPIVNTQPYSSAGN